MDDEAHRLKSIIDNSTNALHDLRHLNDPATASLIQDLERTRAEAVAKLASIGGRFAHSEPHRKSA